MEVIYCKNVYNLFPASALSTYFLVLRKKWAVFKGIQIINIPERFSYGDLENAASLENFAAASNAVNFNFFSGKMQNILDKNLVKMRGPKKRGINENVSVYVQVWVRYLV